MRYLQLTRNIVGVLFLLALAIPAHAGRYDGLLEFTQNAHEITRGISKIDPPARIYDPPRPPALNPIHEAPNPRGIENALPPRNPPPSTRVPLENRPGISNTFNSAAKP
jgi:hypothetical protein